MNNIDFFVKSAIHLHAQTLIKNENIVSTDHKQPIDISNLLVQHRWLQSTCIARCLLSWCL